MVSQGSLCGIGACAILGFRKCRNLCFIVAGGRIWRGRQARQARQTRQSKARQGKVRHGRRVDRQDKREEKRAGKDKRDKMVGTEESGGREGGRKCI